MLLLLLFLYVQLGDLDRRGEAMNKNIKYKRLTIVIYAYNEKQTTTV